LFLSWRRQIEEKAVLTDNSFSVQVIYIFFTKMVISADQDPEIVDVFSAREHLNREHRKKTPSCC